MATPESTVQCNADFDTSDEPQAKRPKRLACQRCRRRKQKCDENRPCANCVRSEEECREQTSRPICSVNLPYPPLEVLGGLASLEQRISQLEKTKHRETEIIATGARASGPGNLHTASEQSMQTSVRAQNGHHNEARPERSMLSDDLIGISPAAGLLGTLADAGNAGRESSSISSNSRDVAMESIAIDAYACQVPLEPPILDQAGKDKLFRIYHDNIQTRYPFLWLEAIRDNHQEGDDLALSYFVNMIISISLLVRKPDEARLPQAYHEAFYRIAVTRYLPHVFAKPDPIVHIQAYLLLAMHALFSPSTHRLISVTSAAMRYCVTAQLHRADAEPEAVDVQTKVDNQLRRRVFWTTYVLDRAVGTMFELPFCIPDYQITIKMYANIDDGELHRRCQASFPDDPTSQPHYTSISAALHVVYCRQIQSEILNITLHRDFDECFDKQPNWRRHILEKLDRWKTLVHRYTNPRSGVYMAQEEWLQMIYNFSLVMLYQPNRQTVNGPAGEWTIKACVRAILIFRKYQRELSISEAWMGLIAQFKCGVSLLYCFFATPPTARSAAYDPAVASEAVRACSIILSLLAERWPASKCLRDTFDILASEVPLIESYVGSPGSQRRRIRVDSAQKLMNLLPQVKTIVVHRVTLRMIKEMATQDFSGAVEENHISDQQQQGGDNDDSNPVLENDAASLGTVITGELFQPVTPHFFTLDMSELEQDPFDYASLGFPGLFDTTL